MIKHLIKLANELDTMGLHGEANDLDIMIRWASLYADDDWEGEEWEPGSDPGPSRYLVKDLDLGLSDEALAEVERDFMNKVSVAINQWSDKETAAGRDAGAPPEVIRNLKKIEEVGFENIVVGHEDDKDFIEQQVSTRRDDFYELSDDELEFASEVTIILYQELKHLDPATGEAIGWDEDEEQRQDYIATQRADRSLVDMVGDIVELSAMLNNMDLDEAQRSSVEIELEGKINALELASERSGVPIDDVMMQHQQKDSSHNIKNLVKLSNHLDNKGLAKEADYLDAIIRKYSELSSDEEYAIVRDELMKFLRKQMEPPKKSRDK